MVNSCVFLYGEVINSDTFGRTAEFQNCIILFELSEIKKCTTIFKSEVSLLLGKGLKLIFL